jgi:hypothetical protein
MLLVVLNDWVTDTVNDGLKLVENQRSEIGGRRGLTG